MLAAGAAFCKNAACSNAGADADITLSTMQCLIIFIGKCILRDFFGIIFFRIVLIEGLKPSRRC